ncbi:MAG: lipocalin family protein [Bacteroidales bacterium]|nr:lipocalin family protein [Bacteroidales bacterium]
MKKMLSRLLFLVAVAGLMGGGLSSCGDDDDEEDLSAIDAQYRELIVGYWGGYSDDDPDEYVKMYFSKDGTGTVFFEDEADEFEDESFEFTWKIKDKKLYVVQDGDESFSTIVQLDEKKLVFKYTDRFGTVTAYMERLVDESEYDE